MGRDLQRYEPSQIGYRPRGARVHVPRNRSAPAREPGPGDNLRMYWTVLRERWRIFLVVVLAVVGGVGVGTLLQEPVYRATGLLELMREDDEVVPTEALFRGRNPSAEFLQTQFGILESEALAARVVDSLRLFEHPAVRGDDDDLLSAEGRRKAIGWFQKRLIVDPIEESQLLRVSFDAPDPELATQVVNATLSKYIVMRQQEAQPVVRRLSAQLDSTRVELETAERRLRDYVRENDLMMVEGGEGIVENVRAELRELQDRLTAAQVERFEKESLYDIVVERGRYDIVDDEVLRTLTVRLADLRREYAQVSSTFTDDYPETKRLKRQIDEMEALIAQEHARIGRKITNDYRIAERRERLLRDALERERRTADQLASRSGEYHILHRQVEATRQLYAALQERLKDAEVSVALAGTDVRIIDRAVIPLDPHSPLLKHNLALAVLVGLVLGAGAAFLREVTDPTVRTAEEMRPALPVPILGMIPSAESLGRRAGRIAGGRRKGLPGAAQRRGVATPPKWPRIDLVDRGQVEFLPMAEAFGVLRAAINGNGTQRRSLLITSCRPREGKTTVSVNLALSIARLNKRVLLVDADIRRSSVHKALRIRNEGGLADHLQGRELWTALLHADVVPQLDVLTAGTPSNRASDLLSSPALRTFLEEAEATYDCVIIDAPALYINAADARILAPLTDGVAVVVRSEATPRDLVYRLLEETPNVIGVILNDFDVGRLPDYYVDYYGDHTGPKPDDWEVTIEKGSTTGRST